MAIETEPTAAKDVSRLVENIGYDLRTIARDEVEMGRAALSARFEAIVAEAGIAMLGATVALIGFGLLCLTAVAALHAVIHPLWLRLLIMSGVYLLGGGAMAKLGADRLRHREKHGDLRHPLSEARETLAAIKRGLFR